MKRNIIFFFTFIVSYLTFSQNPVTFETTVKKVSDTNFQLITNATIEEGWRLYSQNLLDGGAIPTEFVYEESNSYTLLGPTIESESITKFDPIFSLDQTYFESFSTFSQDIQIEKNISYEEIIDIPWNLDTKTNGINPLGKIPILLLKDQEPMFDSKVINQYLDYLEPNPLLYPRSFQENISARLLETVADGICDSVVLVFLENYSEQRGFYIDDLEKIILGNGLIDFDRTILLQDSTSVI